MSKRLTWKCFCCFRISKKNVNKFWKMSDFSKCNYASRQSFSYFLRRWHWKFEQQRPMTNMSALFVFKSPFYRPDFILTFGYGKICNYYIRLILEDWSLSEGQEKFHYIFQKYFYEAFSFIKIIILHEIFSCQKVFSSIAILHFLLIEKVAFRGSLCKMILDKQTILRNIYYIHYGQKL